MASTLHCRSPMDDMMTLWSTLQQLDMHLLLCAEAQGLSKDDAVLLGALSENPELSLKPLARSLRLPIDALQQALARLVREELIEPVGPLHYLLSERGAQKLRSLHAQLDPDGVLAQFCIDWSDMVDLLHELRQPPTF